MLEKIVQIKNIGRFRNFAAKGDVQFHKLTLIYAENGRGKTTLCSILRSLQNGKPEFISERKTLDATEPEFVQLRIDNDNYQFTNGAWTKTFPNIHIFDSLFVNDNVCSGDYVEHENKKNLYRVIVGARGVELAREIEDIDRQIRDLNPDLNIKKGLVEGEIPPGIDIEDYLLWQPVSDIKKQIQEKTRDFESLQNASEKSSEIQTKDFLLEVQIPSPPSDFATVLAKELTEIIADAEAKVRNQITRHEMGHRGESWLSEGLGYVKNDECPFCSQDFLDKDLLSAYGAYFSAGYEILRQEVAQMNQHINSKIGEPSLAPAQEAISTNAALAEFWNQFIRVDLPDISFTEIQLKYAELRERCLAFIKKKQESPTEVVTVDDDFNAASAAVEALNVIVAAYNKVVVECNKRINEQKTTSKQDVDLSAHQKEIRFLMANKKRFEPEVSKMCEDFKKIQITKKQLEERKGTVRGELNKYCVKIIQGYEQSINKYLDQFDAGFRITNSRHLYTGGTPSSQYQIEINNTAVDLGDTKTPFGTHCFKTTLSSGDRNALALAFFLAFLELDTDIGKKVIVFDDPFTSLDRFRRTCTQQLIQSLLNSAWQIVVLSHDPFFLKLLSDECPSASANLKTLQMSRAGNTTVIGEWDVQAEVQSAYMKNYSVLLEFTRDESGDSRTVAKTIRPFLEGMLRSHFPGHFLANEWLGDFLGKIRAADPDSGLQHAKADLSEYEAINGYSKRFHHDQNANADLELITNDELHSYVKRTLRLVGGS